VDKVVEELLHPVAKRLAASSVGALVMFWSIGLLLFHFYHPQPWLICRTGGTDLCGLLSGEAKRTTIAVLCLVVAVAATSLAAFSQAADTTLFLSGCNWRLLRWPGTWLQEHARKRATDRAFPGWKTPPKTADRPLPTGRDGRGSWLRYPLGPSRQKPDDPPLLRDVPLEPTFLGNVFAASWQRVLDWDGLLLNSRIWQALLTFLPQQDVARLQAESADLLLRAQTIVFCIATSAWAVWLPGWQWKACWVLVWLLIAYATYRKMCGAAGRYCDCVEGIIALHGSELHKRLGVPPLVRTIDEQLGRATHLGFLRPHAPHDTDTSSLRHEDEDENKLQRKDEDEDTDEAG
jgi:hypothetical protein